MEKKYCQRCEKDKDPRGGRVCERNHFYCKTCVEKDGDWLFSRPLTKCKICGTKLR